MLSRKIVQENVIQILKMKHGELCKWVASIQSDVTLLERRLNVRGA